MYDELYICRNICRYYYTTSFLRACFKVGMCRRSVGTHYPFLREEEFWVGGGGGSVGEV